MTQILLISYGNPLRRDDGAGLVLADRLAAHWQVGGLAVQQLVSHQLVPEIAAEIATSSAAAVVFVDAAAVVMPTAVQLAESLNSPSVTRNSLPQSLSRETLPDGSVDDVMDDAVDDGSAMRTDQCHKINIRALAADPAILTLGHYVDPQLILCLASHLYDSDLPGWLVTVPGFDFRHGEGLSCVVREQLERSSEIANLLVEEILLSIAR